MPKRIVIIRIIKKCYSPEKTRHFIERNCEPFTQEIIYSRIKIQYYRIALACKRVRRRRGKSVAEKIFCSVMSCSADLIL